MSIRCLLLALVFVGAASLNRDAHAQQPERRVITHNSDGYHKPLTVDALVLDGAGHRISDLKEADFTLKSDGEVQTLTHFDPPGSFDVKPGTEIHGTIELNKLAPKAPVNIVLLDEFNTRFEDMAFARSSLKKWLDRHEGPLTEPTMLIAVDIQHFTMLQDYTCDKQTILDAMRKHLATYPWHLNQASWDSARYGQAFLTLRQVAEATLGHPGHKNMIWLGRGFPYIDLGKESKTGRLMVSTVVAQTLNELLQARVTMYTVDPAGVSVDPFKYGADTFRPYFSNLADATGGRNLFGSNAVDAEINTTIRDSSAYYALTYDDYNLMDERHSFHPYELVLSRSDVLTHAPHGYYAPLNGRSGMRPSGEMTGALRNELDTAANTNLVYDAIGLDIHPKQDQPNTYVIHLDGKGLPWHQFETDGDFSIHVVILATTFDDKNVAIKHMLRDAHLNISAERKKTQGPGVTLEFPVEITANAARLRFVIHPTGQSSERMGTADFQLVPQ